MNLFGFLSGSGGGSDPEREAAARRSEAWTEALDRNRLPSFVADRLTAARDGRVPWLSTTTPAELLLERSHGIRPVATVSGTCWQHYGYSWTRGHAEGWNAAMARLKQEAVLAGANAVVDVSLRTVRVPSSDSMDFTAVGTAVRMEGIPPGADPPIATVPAIAFMRLLEAGIVPTGVVVGAHYEWLQPWGPVDGSNITANAELKDLSRFWNQVRGKAVKELSDAARQQGANGVLGHTWFGELFRMEDGDDKIPPRFLGRQIVVGTAVSCDASKGLAHAITPVVDMRDELSPLRERRPHGHTAYPATDEEGPI